jgi:hypothetical protein
MQLMGVARAVAGVLLVGCVLYFLLSTKTSSLLRKGEGGIEEPVTWCDKTQLNRLSFFELRRQLGPLTDDEELQYFLNRIACREPFALSRWGDGEYCIIMGYPVKSSRDHWRVLPGKDGGLSRDLKAAFSFCSDSYFVGIPCRDWEKKTPELFQGPQTGRQLTFSTIWIDYNYPVFKKWAFETLPKEQRVYLLISENAKETKGKIDWASEVSFLPALGAGDWGRYRAILIDKAERLARSRRGWVFLISGGPMANVLVHRMWIASRDNIYLDMGSSLDELVKGIKTTDYPLSRACKKWGRMIKLEGGNETTWRPWESHSRELAG